MKCPNCHKNVEVIDVEYRDGQYWDCPACEYEAEPAVWLSIGRWEYYSRNWLKILKIRIRMIWNWRKLRDSSFEDITALGEESINISRFLRG